LKSDATWKVEKRSMEDELINDLVEELLTVVLFLSQKLRFSGSAQLL
jgi:hypothetical protein